MGLTDSNSGIIGVLSWLMVVKHHGLQQTRYSTRCFVLSLDCHDHGTSWHHSTNHFVTFFQTLTTMHNFLLTSINIHSARIIGHPLEPLCWIHDHSWAMSFTINNLSPQQEDVDTAIRVLMKAGAYNLELRRAYEEGEDITASGTRDAWWWKGRTVFFLCRSDMNMWKMWNVYMHKCTYMYAILHVCMCMYVIRCENMYI